MLAFLALTPAEKSTLLCNMIAIHAGKGKISEQEKDFILSAIDNMTEVLANDAILQNRTTVFPVCGWLVVHRSHTCRTLNQHPVSHFSKIRSMVLHSQTKKGQTKK